MDELPAGWVRHGSGIVVPAGTRRPQRLTALGRLIVALIIAAAPIANGVSAMSRALVDVTKATRALMPSTHPSRELVVRHGDDGGYALAPPHLPIGDHSRHSADGAHVANPEHLARLEKGVKTWNAWRRAHPDEGIDLDRADFVAAKLAGADFREASLAVARFYASSLAGADFRGANLGGVDFRGADLRGADLRETKLVEANLAGAILSGANLSSARVGVTLFAGVDLRNVTGLDTIAHFGPSTIGIDTLFRSAGEIPEAFLRGAGVPETLIAYIPSLVRRALDYYTCFISHSGRDRRFCDRLHSDLQAKGVRVWYFYEDARWGEPVWGEIDQSIRSYDKLVVVCSKDALQSGPVLREIERALQREDREGKNVLFPLTIDDYLFDSWEHPRKADVIAKVAADFRSWQRSLDTYTRAFDRFLKALLHTDP